MDANTSSSAALAPENDALVGKAYPTDAELAFFGNFATVVDGSDLVRSTTETLKLPPTRIKLKNLDKLPTSNTLDVNIGILFDIFIRWMKAGACLKTTRFWLNLRHPGYEKAPTGFWMPHRTYDKLNGHTLMNEIARHSQSNRNLGLDETLILSMRIFTKDKKALPGRGHRAPEEIRKMFDLHHGHNVVGDSHCLPKALAMGKLWSDMQSCSDPGEKKTMACKLQKVMRKEGKAFDNRCRIQMERAMDLLEEAGMDVDQMEHNLEDLEKLAEYLDEYHICIWEMPPHFPFPVVREEFNKGAENFIPLFYHDGHYDHFHPTVENVQARFCFRCHKVVGANHARTCETKCRRCGNNECEPEEGVSIWCERCNITFRSQECYKRHLEKKTLKAFPYCDVYEKESYSKVKHECFSTYLCKICQTRAGEDHQCVHVIPSEKDRNKQMDKQKEWKMVIYDCESIVASTAEYTGAQSLGGKHVPNVLCYKIICQTCLGKECACCGPMQVLSSIEEPEPVIQRFVEVLRSDLTLKNAYIIAHNGGRYDHVFTLEEMISHEKHPANFVMNGNTFILVDVPTSIKTSFHFRDSVKYLPMKLSQMPAAFDLDTKSKGYFPYMFNHPGNYGVNLPGLPPIEYYEPQYMGTKDKEQFEKWYDANKEKPFDFNREIVDYCKNDVQILVEALVKFITICQTIFSGWNPIVQASTLASYIQFIMKHDHIKPGVLGYIPENGYGGRNNSKIALKYLMWLEHKNPGLKLIHKLSKEGEFYLECGNTGFFVDGYDPETKEVYEVHGCLWHGCNRCWMDQEAKCPANKNRTMGELYETTIDRDDIIRAAGYTLHVKWECDINEDLRKDKEMRDFFKNCNHTHHLQPREGMYGGRTQQFQSLVKACSKYSIEYFDFCSLYPYINMKGAEYPVGAPKRIVSDFEPIVPGRLPYRGVIFCDILPPLDCKLPVIPTRSDGKLLFVLCRTCGHSKNPKRKCTHTKISERFLTGVWCTDELNLAIEEGYKVLRYHEVWHWDEWFRGGFFSSFMEPLLKMKHESSGLPENVVTEQDIDKYIEEIFQNEGIKLDIDKIKKNPALRSLAKLFLNSTWGKLAQNPCKSDTKLFPIQKAVSAVQFMCEPGMEPKCFEEWKDTHILVSRKPTHDAVHSAKFTNIVYGALTTSAARVKLYQAMKLVGPENLIYCDTDSIIFRQERGTNPLESLRGNGLGQLTDETPAGWHIDEIVAMAPKVYAYKMVNESGEEKYSVRAKGFTLNHETAEKINFFTMKQMMLRHLKKEEANTTVNKMAMKRGSNILDGIETTIDKKRLRPVMDKGNFASDGSLIPFGLMNPSTTIEDDYMY
ncbi:hypothetical protein GCK72_020502 [Caenorhabditis remanei]|uniref:DNA-directed DNA polymerase n=1 Tax=Caenorhabditis remanei TaxID=31234 RepID=A0A6A5GHA3_CAERE|nr:hypothetical protein GCK72_020502 [Caenorhabditis remanei]KAF1753945.1 hypothetical protein GCK72_020502 [Caenorhabditis remanei]